MRAEFLKDEMGNVWFSYANNIKYRECGSRVPWKENGDMNEEQVEAHNKAQQDMLHREMETYQKNAKFERAKDFFVMKQMHGFMEDYYQNMKNEMGIDATYGIEEQDPPLAEVLDLIRPNVTAKNFKDYLQKTDNVHKTQKWRRISRKVHKDEHMAGFRETATAKQFFSVRNMKHLAQSGGQTNAIENLLSALEVVNKEAMLEGAGGGIHGPAADILSGIR